ncbi:MAG: MBL fold metallo-hydrolase [Balneolaceae bacterium]|nr:MBL fold metallo-hydrolase [Balneolaceae bacterium]
MEKKAEVFPLYEGTFSVGTDKKFKRIGKEDSPEKGALKLSIHPFLIREESRNILFDAGIGELFGSDTSIKTLLDNLAEHSVSDYEISDIFVSHLHFDHFAGLAHRDNGYWELTFPDATVWVSEGGWKKLYSSIEKEDEDTQDFFNFVDSKATIEFLGEKSSPIEHVRSKTIGGHTEFHQALFYENGEQKFIMAGDVIGRRISINRSFAAKFDFDPKQSMNAREELKELACKKKYTLLAYHETDYPMFKLMDLNPKKGYTVKTLS